MQRIAYPAHDSRIATRGGDLAFTRVAATFDAQTAGGGLGMAIVRRMCCMIDGVSRQTLPETKCKPRFPGRDGLPGLAMALARRI
jgi:hypothetical protein